MVLPPPSLAWCRYYWERAAIQVCGRTHWQERAATRLGFSMPEFTGDFAQLIHFWYLIRRWLEIGHPAGVIEPAKRVVTRATAPAVRAEIDYSVSGFMREKS